MPSSQSYLRKPLIMGILNVTPDSFSDGGRFVDPAQAFQHAQSMIEQGADIIDIGGESTRPGAPRISDTEELERVIPVIERIQAASDTMLSIDTQKAYVMQEAVNAGAGFINDINALRSPDALSTAASLDLPICLMHMQGEPSSMQVNPTYTNHIIDEINAFFTRRIQACENAKIPREHLIIDPGIGFGKSVEHNLTILKHLSSFKVHQLPILLGVSRKSTIGVIIHKLVLERLSAGIAAAVFAALQGVTIIRTHDVAETKQALDMLDSIVRTQ
jgi:dihydropteroate synthase